MKPAPNVQDVLELVQENSAALQCCPAELKHVWVVQDVIELVQEISADKTVEDMGGLRDSRSSGCASKQVLACVHDCDLTPVDQKHGDMRVSYVVASIRLRPMPLCMFSLQARVKFDWVRTTLLESSGAHMVHCLHALRGTALSDAHLSGSSTGPQRKRCAMHCLWCGTG